MKQNSSLEELNLSGLIKEADDISLATSALVESNILGLKRMHLSHNAFWFRSEDSAHVIADFTGK